MDKEFKWHIELLRIALILVPMLCSMVWFVGKMDKQISLNTLSIQNNQKAIMRISDNELPHLQAGIDDIKKSVVEVREMVIKIGGSSSIFKN